MTHGWLCRGGVVLDGPWESTSIRYLQPGSTTQQVSHCVFAGLKRVPQDVDIDSDCVVVDEGVAIIASIFALFHK